MLKKFPKVNILVRISRKNLRLNMWNNFASNQYIQEYQSQGTDFHRRWQAHIKLGSFLTVNDQVHISRIDQKRCIRYNYQRMVDMFHQSSPRKFHHHNQLVDNMILFRKFQLDCNQFRRNHNLDYLNTTNSLMNNLRTGLVLSLCIDLIHKQ